MMKIYRYENKELCEIDQIILKFGTIKNFVEF
jgi:hypothetical protein